MPNKNYINGRNKEYKVMARLRREGFDIMTRSAGSHSPADVIAISKDKKLIKFIQCKPKHFSKPEARRIEGAYAWLNDEFMSSFEVE